MNAEIRTQILMLTEQASYRWRQFLSPCTTLLRKNSVQIIKRKQPCREQWEWGGDELLKAVTWDSLEPGSQSRSVQLRVPYFFSSINYFLNAWVPSSRKGGSSQSLSGNLLRLFRRSACPVKEATTTSWSFLCRKLPEALAPNPVAAEIQSYYKPKVSTG